jgi:hypothetical protein
MPAVDAGRLGPEVPQVNPNALDGIVGLGNQSEQIKNMNDAVRQAAETKC